MKDTTKVTDAVCLCLLSKGFKTKFTYRGVDVILSLKGEVVWEGEAGEGGDKFVAHIIRCGRELEALSRSMPQDEYKSGLAAAALLLKNN